MWRTASILVCIVLVLITLGIVMLASTSGVQGQTQFDDPNYFLKRQVAWLVIACIAGIVTSSVDYHVWRPLAVPLLVVSAILLILAIVPHIGLTIKGSSRWIRLGPMNFQPSELAKFSVIIFLAWWMARIQRHAVEFKLGLFIPLASLGVILGLIFIEPDFGTTLLIATVGMTMMFMGGTRMGYLLVAAVTGLCGFALAVMHNEVRMRRITAFLYPEKYEKTYAYQLWNAIYAFVVGGGYGVGLGQSLQKHFYLPEAHTDFIFAILGEELGLAASILVIVLFLGLFICGIRISSRSTDQFGRLVGFGITLMITLQAAINIGVVTGCLPTKGLPLPFISFGGSSLVTSFAMIGVLVNIAGKAAANPREAESHFIKDAAHRI